VNDAGARIGPGAPDPVEVLAAHFLGVAAALATRGE
jgi:hypothetical protein